MCHSCEMETAIRNLNQIQGYPDNMTLDNMTITFLYDIFLVTKNDLHVLDLISVYMTFIS